MPKLDQAFTISLPIAGHPPVDPTIPAEGRQPPGSRQSTSMGRQHRRAATPGADAPRLDQAIARGPDLDACPSHADADGTEVRSQPRYWRSLADRNSDDAFVNRQLNREFPVAASEFPDGVSRRRWMQLMGASLTMAGVAGCRYPEELIVPFVIRPVGRIPGEPYSTATNFELAGEVLHLLVSCVDGRPVKVEPNNAHPAGGVTGTFGQASTLSLFDPDRLRGEEGAPLRREKGRMREDTWETFDNFARNLVKASGRGERIAVLMPPTASPSMVRMLGRMQSKLPAARVVTYDSIDGGVMDAATRKAFGRPASQAFDFSDAKCIVSLQADFLGADKGSGQNAKTFAAHRDPMAGEMSRLYVAEGGYTTTGAAADARVAIRPSQMPAVLAELGRRVETARSTDEFTVENPPAAGQAYSELGPQERLERWLDAAAADLAAAGDKGVVVIGETLGADVVIAGMAMNQKLGSFGSIQKFADTVDGEVQNRETIFHASRNRSTAATSTRS